MTDQEIFFDHWLIGKGYGVYILNGKFEDFLKSHAENFTAKPTNDETEPDADWAAISEVILEMPQIEKMNFLRERMPVSVKVQSLKDLDRDEYDFVIGDILLDEWPELPMTGTYFPMVEDNDERS